MIEDYGTLSEEELLEEIQQKLVENTELDASELEFKFEGGKLLILGNLQNEDELENLVGVLENHVEPEDYQLEVELVEGPPRKIEEDALTEKADTESESKEGVLEESLEEIDDDEMDFVDQEGFDDDKW